MKRNFRKVLVQRLEGNFYSFGAISHLWLRFALVRHYWDKKLLLTLP